MTDQERKEIFSKNLLRVLHEHDKIQVDVAKAIGVSQQTFNTWCRGIALPRMGKIQLLADYFNIDMSELISEKTAAVPSCADIQKEELLRNYELLNDEGRKNLLNQSRLLVKSGDFARIKGGEDFA